MCCMCLPRRGRSCARWSRMMEPGNRGWPSSWSRWWPWWLWRAEDHTSQGALGRDPITNRAVPERRPVPIFFPSCDFLPPPFRDDFFLGLFSASSCPEIFWVFHPHCCINLFIWEKSERWFWTEAVLHSATWGIPHLYHFDRFVGWMLERWPYWRTSLPLQEEDRGKAFYVAFKNLHW